MLTCPRCTHRFEHSNDHQPEWLHCIGCDFEFRFFEFQRQSKRVSQVAARPQQSQLHYLLCDAPNKRSEGAVSISLREWLCWKFGHRKTADTITMRSAIHELVQAGWRLGQLYPAIPRGVHTAVDVNRFWTDPHHRFALDAIESAARDGSFIATEFLAEGRLTKGEYRHIVDAELPHSSWAGLAVTYSPGKPETRGLLLALTLLRARGSQIPTLLLDLQHWFREDGWDEYGCAVRTDEENS